MTLRFVKLQTKSGAQILVLKRGIKHNLLLLKLCLLINIRMTVLLCLRQYNVPGLEKYQMMAPKSSSFIARDMNTTIRCGPPHLFVLHVHHRPQTLGSVSLSQDSLQMEMCPQQNK
jgi:hypothetical protein